MLVNLAKCVTQGLIASTTKTSKNALNVDTPSDSSLLKARNLIIRVMHRTPFVRCIQMHSKTADGSLTRPITTPPQRTPFPEPLLLIQMECRTKR